MLVSVIIIVSQYMIHMGVLYIVLAGLVERKENLICHMVTVTVDSSGNLYVCDIGNDRLIVL